MEDRRNRTSQELASTEKELRGFGVSRRSQRGSSKKLKPPEIEISLSQNLFAPGDSLKAEYEVLLYEEQTISAVETSVIWLTEGKGEQNIGVHFFERRQQSLINSGAFDEPQRISSTLPASPLSYDGQILKIRWAVRVRLFLSNGEQVTEDKFFTLGTVQPFCQLESDEQDSSEQETKVSERK